MRYLLVITLLMLTVGLSAQVKFGATATGRHVDAVNDLKKAKEDIKVRRQQIKKYKQAKKQYEKAFNKEKEQRIREKERLADNYKEAKKNLREKRKKKNDSTPDNQSNVRRKNSIPISEQDSIKVAKDILSSSSFPSEYKTILEDSSQYKGVDSIALTMGTKEVESYTSDFLPDEMHDPKELSLQSGDMPYDPSSLSPPTMDDALLGNAEKPSRPNPNLVKPERVQELFSKVDPEVFVQAQHEVTKLKKKYSELPDTRFPEDGTKRSSLGDRSFTERMHMGGTINAVSTDPVVGAINLQVGYWLNKKWLIGTGFILRQQLNKRDSLIVNDAFGYSLFVRHDIKAGFFLWGETERQVNKSLFLGNLETTPEWQASYMLGGGRDFKIGSISMMSLFLYDFNHHNNTINSRPFVIKIGFSLLSKPE